MSTSDATIGITECQKGDFRATMLVAPEFVAELEARGAGSADGDGFHRLGCTGVKVRPTVGEVVAVKLRSPIVLADPSEAS